MLRDRLVDAMIPVSRDARCLWARNHAANIVTAMRIVMTLPFLVAAGGSAAGGPAWPSVALFVAIAASDVLDGHLARRFGVAGNTGRLFDHVTDILFIMSALCLYMWLGVVPWWVPTAVGLSFAVYGFDSWLGRGPIPGVGRYVNRIGHVGGVVNYVLIGVLVTDRPASPFDVPPAFLQGFLWLVVILSAASILSRLAQAVGASRERVAD